MAESRNGSFAVEVDIAAPPPAVFTAFVEVDTRRRWLRVPGRVVTTSERDRVVDAVESIEAVMRVGEVEEHLERTTRVLALVTAEPILFAYRALVPPAPDGRPWSRCSLHEGPPGTTLTWTERHTLLQGADDEAYGPHLRLGTRLQLNGLATALGVAARPATDR